MGGFRQAAPIRASAPAPTAARRADLVACIALVVICLAFFWPIFLSRPLVPADGIYFIDHAFAPFRPAAVTWPVNTLLVADQVYVIYPWRVFSSESLAAGYVPLWNPYYACGQSFIGNDQSAVMDPTNMLLNLCLHPAAAQTVLLLATLIAASLFTYGLTRSLGGLPPGSFLAALTFGFGGFMFIWLGYPLAATAMWLPALLWATHQLVLRPSLRGAVLVALIIGWQFTSGHLSTSAQMLAFWALFLAYEWIEQTRERGFLFTRRIPVFVAIALLLGIGLGSAQLLPLRESFGLSSISAMGRSRWVSECPEDNIRRALLGDWWFLRHIARGEIALLLLPERHGNPAFGDYHGHPDYGNYAERASYVGFLGLLAMLAGVLRRPAPGPARFFLYSALIVFGVLLHLPVFNTVSYLPFIRYTNPARLRFIFTLCAAVSVGLALPSLCTPDTESPGRPRHLWALALALTVAIVALALQTALRLSPDWTCLTSNDRAVRLAKLIGPVAAGLAVVGVLILAERRALSPSRTALALLALVLLDLGLFGACWHAPASSTTLLPDIALVDTARAVIGDSRLTGPPNVFAPNIAMAYGLRDVRAYDPICTGRFVTLVETLTALAPARTDKAESPVKGQYVPCPTLDRLTSAGIAWRWDASRGPWLERLSAPLPHAYLAPQVEFASSSKVLSRLAGGADPHHTTIIESAVNTSHSPAGLLVPATIVSYQPHHVVIRLLADRPGWLVLTDSYYPGWHAAVNGRRTPISIANYAFRAVPVPAGDLLITFDYEPASFRIGLFLSLISLSICCLFLAVALGSTFKPLCPHL